MTTTSNRNRPPGPAGLPIFGSALESQRALEFLLENRRDYGDVVYYEFLNESIYQLNHPDDIESVLVTNNRAFTKSHLTKDVLGPVAGEGLFTSDGDIWREQRRHIQPAFHPDQIAVYGEMMVDTIDRRAVELGIGPTDKNHRGDASHDARHCHLGAPRHRHRIRSRTNRLRPRYHLRLTWQRLASHPPGMDPDARKLSIQPGLQSLESVVDGIIAERQTGADGDDVVSKLRDTEFTDGDPMSGRQLRDEVMTFLVAGHETTAQALTFTCYLLATHSNVEARLFEEVKDVLEGNAPSVAAMRSLTLSGRSLGAPP